MGDAKAPLLVGITALVIGAIIGGLIGHFAVPRADPNAPTEVPTEAQCVLQEASPGNSVSGTIMLKRMEDNIMITGTVSGLSAGKHGFHVHAVGSTADGCKAAKGHFNPFGKQHGSPNDEERHVGDLGNIDADASQLANVNIVDSVVKFAGDANILGRSIVIHAGEDDLGLGGASDSKTTGHAGARLACCVIGAVN